MRTDAEAERQDIRERFAFHSATVATGPKHDAVRAQHRALALWIAASVPLGREREQALLALQSSMMWCNAGVAIRTEPEPLGLGSRDEA